jgi:predicted SnoaL-like aldol condensation-catalyzing enzyme/predicted ester cyclase
VNQELKSGSGIAQRFDMSSSEQTKKFILEAFDTLFNKRDYAKAAKFWSPNYIQHSAHIPPGREGLFGLVRAAPSSLRYENFLILAEGDHAMLHGRFSGHAGPRPWLAADRLRLEDGLLAEHWDVLADEPTRTESVSGLPAVGDSFADPVHPPTAGFTASTLTVEEAQKITAPLYDALNQPATKDVQALLAQAAHPDYRSFHTNEEFLTRDELAEVFKNIGASVPDLRWTVKNIQVSQDQIVVRGEATGTPTGEFWGAKATGKGFKTMAIDVFTVRNGKLASAYHVENWMTALQQINR